MERCFSCAEVGKCTELYARKPFDCRVPYFPIFERFNPPSSSNSISADGKVKVCELCHIFLLSQWQNYERQGIVESRRIYFTKRHDGASYNNTEHYLSSNSDINFGNKSNYSLVKNGDQRSDSINSSTKTPLSLGGNLSSKNGLGEVPNEKNDIPYECNTDVSNKQLTEHHICCFVCGLPCLKWHAKTAYSTQVLENKEYFPFFEKLDPPQLSIGLTNGATKICIQCESDLQKQWEHYESLGTDQMRRTYHITNEHNSTFSITNPGRFITNSMMNNPLFSVIKMKNSTVKCALCPNKVIDPYTVSWNQRTSCLCISNLKNFPFPTEGVMVDKQSEEAIICDVCHYFLSYQMQAYTTNMTPMHLREYKLPKVGSLSPILPAPVDKQSVNNRKPVTLGSSLSAFSAPEGWQQSNSQSKRSKTPTPKRQSKTPVQYGDSARLHPPSSKPMDQSSQVLGPIIANCHICLHELRDPSTLKTLPSVVNDDNPDQPYFPFLKTLRMNSMKNYEFPVCIHCYYNLHGQWQIFQNAGVPIYERKYNHNEFMCTHCQHLLAQKSDIMIVRDRLLCVPCSENRACEAAKNTHNMISNQDADATSHNSLLSMKTKTTVTVTPISNELSGPNLASLNYGDTMKQLNAKLFEASTPLKTISTSTPVPANNPMNQFGDISRNSSDIYQNSKNLFGKSMKRPVVAAVAPNQRQNTPHEPLSDLRIKMPDMSSYPGSMFNQQNSAFNSFVSGQSSYPGLPMFSANSSAFALHSPHSGLGRRSSSKSDRDGFMSHPANNSNMSSGQFMFDQKSSRINTPSMVVPPPPSQSSSTSSNPFINWTQHHQPPLDPFPAMFESSQALSSGSSSKEAEMTMLLYMMYQKQMHMASDPGLTKFGTTTNNNMSNSWLGGASAPAPAPPSLEEMTLNYYQSMMAASQHPGPAGMFSPEDFMAASSATSNGGAVGGGPGLQSYMMNAAMANYQYNQMVQMLAAYQQQQHAAVSGLSTNKPQAPPQPPSLPPANIPNWFNQFTMAEQVSKRMRPDNMMYDVPNHTKSLTPNGFNDMLKYSELLKSSIGSEYEKSMSTKYPASMNMISSGPGNNLDLRQSHKLMDHTDIKMCKQSRDETSFSGESRKSVESSYSKPSVVHTVNHHTDSKVRRQSKTCQETDVLDLSSQNKPVYKSSYAIDSLAELTKSCERTTTAVDSKKFDHPRRSSVSIYDKNEVKLSSDTFISVADFEEPLNMYNVRQTNSEEEYNTKPQIPKPPSLEDRLLKLLTKIETPSLIDVLKSTPIIADLSKSCSSSSSSKPRPRFTIFKFHRFINSLGRMLIDCDQEKTSAYTRRKSSFMEGLGLQNSLPLRQDKSLKKIECYLTKPRDKGTLSQNPPPNEQYWSKWILRNLRHRLSVKMKPHLLRSLMRPVLSGDIEVRLCTARNKHELETLRSILKILIRFT